MLKNDNQYFLLTFIHSYYIFERDVYEIHFNSNAVNNSGSKNRGFSLYFADLNLICFLQE